MASVGSGVGETTGLAGDVSPVGAMAGRAPALAVVVAGVGVIAGGVTGCWVARKPESASTAFFTRFSTSSATGWPLDCALSSAVRESTSSPSSFG